MARELSVTISVQPFSAPTALLCGLDAYVH